MELSFAAGAASEVSAQLLALLVEDPDNPPDALSALDEQTQGAARRELERGRMRAGKGDVLSLAGGADGPERIVLAGLGPDKDGRAEAVRLAGARIVQAARAVRIDEITLVAPAGDHAAEDLAALVEGATLGGYRYDRFKSRRGDGDDDAEPATKSPARLTIVGASDGAGEEARVAATVAAATNWARDLANTPANHLTPAMLSEQARSLADQHDDLTWSELDRTQLEQDGYGLIAAVGQASVNEPRLIVLEWNPPADSRGDGERLALVGKAVTFDTGGISIKPSAGMAEMKLDKAGGCAVLGAMRAIAETNVPRRVLAVVGAAENMPGGRAYKPGDVITAKDGTTVEVTNTDAEGRLVLGDAIVHARQLGCAAIVELSTLTGAMVVALGHHFCGMIARDSDLAQQVLAAGRATGDHTWHLPMHDAYRAALKSDCADMVNSGSRAGSSLYAGLFLEHFARDTPFVHLDVAGTAMLPKPQRYLLVKGASGWGVRLLRELATSF